MTIVLNQGNCPTCKASIKVGEKFNREVRHNCNNCGYYQNYNEVLVIIKRGKVTEVLG